MARPNEPTESLLDANGDASIALAGVELQEGDLRYPEVMGSNFLTYAVSVLTDRALPDVRDGLLPVQRRILLAMNDLRLRSTSGHRKCAKVVGECMGNYHPHGDLAIYGALVRMAQEFSLRSPLVDGQGNFGNQDGDGAAASRYTECRLTELAERVLGQKTSIGDKEVDALDAEVLPEAYGRNYDESRPEAKVLPSALPNLLINGNTGIAVGMTCTMLPHNPGEIMDIAVWRLANPEATPEQVIKRISGPDFPTGALVIDNEGLRNAYLTGEGKVTAVGEAHVEPLPGNREKIIITSVPWGVSKGSGGKGTGLLEIMAKQHAEGRWPEWTELADLSTDDTRIEIELKRGSNARAVLARLYKYTRLKHTYGVQQNVLVDGRPRTLGFTEVLDHWLVFRRYVLIKVAEKRMREIEIRLHKIEAFQKAIDSIDAVVKTIRSSKNRLEAKPKLMKLLKIDEQQSTWIVEMPLGNLTSLETADLKNEQKRLSSELKMLQKFIQTPELITQRIVEELRELKKAFHKPRETRIVGADIVGDDEGPGLTEFSVAAEDCLLLISDKGQAVCGQGTLSRGASLQLASGERMITAADARTDQEWMIFTASGKAFRLRLAELPLVNKRDKGMHLSEVIGLERNDAVVAAHKLDKERVGAALFVYASGMVKRTEWSEYARVVPSGIVAAAPKPGDKVVSVHDCPENGDVMLVGTHGKGIRFPAAEMRAMGRAAAGVRGINLPAGAELAGDAVVVGDARQMLLVTDTRFAKRIPLGDLPAQGRGGSGVSLMKPGGKYGAPAHIAICDDKSELWLQREGKLTEYPAAKVSRAGRAIVPKLFEPAAKTEVIFVRQSE